MGGNRIDVWQGTLALMALKTLEVPGPPHSYSIARLTRAGRKHLTRETRDWEQTTAILAGFLAPEGGRS